MNTNPEQIEIVHNKLAKRFEVELDQYVAVLTYRMADDDKKIIFTHTGVPPALSGQGIASKMAVRALTYAREEELGVVPVCPFVSSYIRRHQEYQDLVVEW